MAAVSHEVKQDEQSGKSGTGGGEGGEMEERGRGGGETSLFRSDVVEVRDLPDGGEENGGRELQLFAKFLADTKSTKDYNSSNAELHLLNRVGLRNAVCVLHTFPPALICASISVAVRLLIGALSQERDHQLWMAVTFATLFGELSVVGAKSTVQPAYIRSKAPLWLVMVFVWFVCVYVTGGVLREYIFLVQVLAYFLGMIASGVMKSLTLNDIFQKALSTSILMSGMMAMCTAYVSATSTIQNPLLEMIVAGLVYPLFAHSLKELGWELVAPSHDARLGIKEADDPEAGIYIPCLLGIQAALEVPNKYIIVSITSESGFLFSTVTSLAVEVVSSFASMYWHRSKGYAADIVISRVISRVSSFDPGVEPASLDRDSRSQARTKTTILKKASHRHSNASGKKRYEFRYFYMELAECVSSVSAALFVIVMGTISPRQGLFRLSIALAMEFISNVFVWGILEREGYILANCVARLTTHRLVVVVFAACGGLVCCLSGNLLAAMYTPVVNGTAVAVGGNGTEANVTTY